MNNRKSPEGEVSICGKWQGTRAVPGHGTWLGRGQSCGSGDSVCGPALITAAETVARGPGFYSNLSEMFSSVVGYKSFICVECRSLKDTGKGHVDNEMKEKQP